MTIPEAIVTGIISGFTVLGVAVRWSASIIKAAAGLVAASINGFSAEAKEVRESLQKLVSDIHELKQQHDVAKKIDEAVEAVVDEVSGVHDAAPEAIDAEKTGDFDVASARTPVMRRTPGGGYRVPRARSRGR